MPIYVLSSVDMTPIFNLSDICVNQSPIGKSIAINFSSGQVIFYLTNCLLAKIYLSDASRYCDFKQSEKTKVAIIYTDINCSTTKKE